MLIAHAAATRESKPKGERIGASLCKTYMPTVVNLAMPGALNIGDEIVRTTLIFSNLKPPGYCYI